MLYHRDGMPVTSDEDRTQFWRDWENPKSKDARIVARWKSPDGRFLVSTVFLALDHNHGRGVPLIFETMVFHDGDWSGVDCQRYETESMAMAGHDAMVTEIKLIEGIEADATEPGTRGGAQLGSEPVGGK